MNSSAPGWVYVITNPAMPDLLKVGYSMKHPSLRADELYHTNNPHPFVVQYEVLVPNPSLLESLVHSELAQFNEGKEWFRCKVSHSISEIRRVCQENRLNILFEQDSSLNEEDQIITFAIKNVDPELFKNIVWSFWPNQLSKTLNSHLHLKYYQEYFEKNGEYAEGYPKTITSSASPSKILEYTLQQVTCGNQYAAGYLTDFVIENKVVSNKDENMGITSINVLDKTFILSDENSIKNAKLYIKKYFAKIGYDIFTESIIDDFRDHLSDIEFNQKNTNNNTAAHELNSLYLQDIAILSKDFFQKNLEVIKKSTTSNKVNLISRIHMVAYELQNSIDENFNKLKNTTDFQIKKSKEIIESCKSTRLEIVKNIIPIYHELSHENLSICAGILEIEKDYENSEKYHLGALYDSHKNAEYDSAIHLKYEALTRFYSKHGTPEQLFNFRINYAKNFAKKGEHLATVSLTIANLYGLDAPRRFHSSGRPEVSKNPLQAAYWYKLVLENTMENTWKPKYQDGREKMLSYRKMAIENLNKLISNHKIEIDKSTLELMASSPPTTSNKPINTQAIYSTQNSNSSFIKKISSLFK